MNPEYPLPAAFRERMETELGAGRAAALFAALDRPPSVSVRLHPRRIAGDRLDWCLRAGLPADRLLSVCPDGVLLRKKPVFTLDPLFHAGCYYVQEASSMSLQSLAPCLEECPEPRVLDLCAAPGGKTTHLLSMLDGRGMLVCNEVIASRATVLADNVAKWGYPAVVTSSDPADFAALDGFFDVVVVDAPCSGEGMFRKDPASRLQWNAESPAFCAARQRRILKDVWPALRPGGILAYSTCTFNAEEDGGTVSFVTGELGAECLSARHFYPGEAEGEGFFLALLRKDGDVPARTPRSRTGKGPRAARATAPYRGRIPGLDTGSLLLFSREELIKGIPPSWAGVLEVLEERLRVIRSGIALARVRGKDLVPESDAAWSLLPRTGELPRVELSREEALAYLRGTAPVPAGVRGYAEAAFGGYPLGYFKCLGNRSNNLYPAHLRIRMAAP